MNVSIFFECFCIFRMYSEPGESSSCDHHSHLSGDWLVSARERELFDSDDPQRARVLQHSRSDLGVRPHDTPTHSHSNSQALLVNSAVNRDEPHLQH